MLLRAALHGRPPLSHSGGRWWAPDRVPTSLAAVPSSAGVEFVFFLKRFHQTLLLSKQFVQWDEMLAQMEAAKQLKPASE